MNVLTEEEKMKFECITEKQLPAVAEQILTYARGIKLFVLEGEIGAGKTTLIKYLCSNLGVKNNVSSPTFTLIHEYRLQEEMVYHLDFYRIKSSSEIYDLGYEDYLFSGNYCFVEWPQKLENMIPFPFIRISINLSTEASAKVDYLINDQRTLIIEKKNYG